MAEDFRKDSDECASYKSAEACQKKQYAEEYASYTFKCLTGRRLYCFFDFLSEVEILVHVSVQIHRFSFHLTLLFIGSCCRHRYT